MIDLSHVPSRRELRIFALVVATGFCVVGGIAFYRTRTSPDHPVAWICWAIAAVLVVLGLAAPPVLHPFFRFWTALGFVLGWINTRIVLAVTFFGLFLPVGLISRLVGRDPLQLARGSHTTYWVKRPPLGRAQERHPRLF